MRFCLDKNFKKIIAIDCKVQFYFSTLEKPISSRFKAAAEGRQFLSKPVKRFVPFAETITR